MLRVPLTPQIEAVLRERAEAHGEDVGVYAARLLQHAFAAPNVEQLLASFRKQVEKSGTSDDEPDALGESLRDEVWQEQQARKAKSA